jgi:putative heme iron utilization protein
MSEAITPAISDRICKHMNQDHGSAIALYAQVYGNTPQTESAIMESIDPQGMNLLAQISGSTVPVRIEFDHPLKDAEDAHHTLVAMIKQARTR